MYAHTEFVHSNLFKREKVMRPRLSNVYIAHCNPFHIIENRNFNKRLILITMYAETMYVSFNLFNLTFNLITMYAETMYVSFNLFNSL